MELVVDALQGLVVVHDENERARAAPVYRIVRDGQIGAARAHCSNAIVAQGGQLRVRDRCWQGRTRIPRCGQAEDLVAHMLVGLQEPAKHRCLNKLLPLDGKLDVRPGYLKKRWPCDEQFVKCVF